MNLLNKSFVISLSFCTALALTACDKSTSETDAETTTEKTIETATDTATTNTEVKKEALMPLSMVTAENLKYSTLIASSQAETPLTDEQKQCIEETDSDAFAQKVDAFYKDKFTETELKELNDFYGSETGKVFTKYGIQQMLMGSGNQLDEPVVTPTEEQMAEVMSTIQKPTFIKYQQLNTGEGEGSFMGTFKDDLNAELKRCGIESDIYQ